MRRRRILGVRGFTLIEMTVIVLIVTILAGLAVRNLTTDQETRDVWQFKTRLVALALRAKTRAIETGTVVSMYFAKDPDAVRIVQEGQDGSQRELQVLPLPRNVKATKFDADKDEASGSQWRLPFFPDGASAGGGIEFQWDAATFSFCLDREGTGPRILDTQLPDLSLNRWPAGGYAPRT